MPASHIALLGSIFENALTDWVVLLVLLTVGPIAGRLALAAWNGRTISMGRQARELRLEKQAQTSAAASGTEGEHDRLLMRACIAFETYQQAWAQQDLRRVRPFVSDAIYERAALQIEEQKRLGYREQVQELRVEPARVAESEKEGHFDVVTVQVTASTVAGAVSLADGSPVGRPERRVKFIEYWSFLRTAGKHARDGKARDGLIEGCCPNCSAPIQMNQWAKCEACSALLRSGEHDWVLAEVTVGREWIPHGARRIPGVEALTARDPGFSMQHLEDRVAVLFWRYVKSLRVGDTTPLSALASDHAVSVVGQEIAAGDRGAGLRTYVGEPAVGAVSTLGLLSNEPDDDGSVWDEAIVQVRWTGVTFQTQGRGMPERLRDRAARTTLLVLRRRKGVRSDLAESFSSAHCPNCGAPEQGGDGGRCQYCSEVLNDGHYDWILADVLARHSVDGDEVVNHLSDVLDLEKEAVVEAAQEIEIPRSEGVLLWMALAAFADGNADRKEIDVLAEMVDKSGVKSSAVDQVIAEAYFPHFAGKSGASAVTAAAASVDGPKNIAETRIWLRYAIRMALADGVITDEEHRLLERLAEQGGLRPADVKLLIGRVRRELLRAAKRELGEVDGKVRRAPRRWRA